MERGDPFDLNAAVARWRTTLSQGGAFGRDELDELEAHLWDLIDARLVAASHDAIEASRGARPALEGSGGPETEAHAPARQVFEAARRPATDAHEPAREAFEAAVWQMGHGSLLESEFRKTRVIKNHSLVLTMLANYLKIALRNLRKQPGHSFINIFGLGLGIAAGFLILLYARHELTYDRFHENADRIHQVYKVRHTPTGDQITRDTWVPLAERLRTDYPAVENAVRVWNATQWVGREDVRFEENVTYTDASLWEIFDFPLARGGGFEDLHSAVISEEAAQKYFGDEDPIGNVLTIDNQTQYRITGLLAPIPSNSSLQIDLAVPFESVPFYDNVADLWSSSFIDTYVLLGKTASPGDLEAQFPALISAVWDADEAARTDFRLEALPNLWNALTGNRSLAYILIGIALAILLIASINFTNLVTARSLERLREIGMRKVLGAHRGQLVAQFLGEAMVMSFAALLLGALLMMAALPFFEGLYAIELEIPLPLVVPLLLVVGAAVGLLAGGYPALYLSRFKPLASLQGRIRTGRGGRRLRHGLVITQFTLAAALIMGTLLVRDQIGYMQGANLHFDRENVVAVQVQQSDFMDPDVAAVRLETFKDELRNLSGVVSVTSSTHIPGDWGNWFTFAWPVEGGEEDRLRMRLSFADDRYFETYGIELVEGRFFDAARPTDADDAVILNESALGAFGWTTSEGKAVRRGDQQYSVVGVVRDYHFQSLENEIAPVLHFYRQPENAVHSFISARIRPDRVTETLAGMQQTWQRVDPDREMPYVFVDDQFAQLYEAEERLATMAGVFTILAILIACLGLFGLASWMVVQRTKEIGVRKVLGASATNIAYQITADFARLVLIAVVLATPLAYFGMNWWLEGFAYRVGFSWPIVAISALAALAVAVLTVSYQSLRAAFSNPVEALRYE